MKKIILHIVFLLFCFTTLLAQNIPQGMSYQAVARDADGQLMSDININVRIALISNIERRGVAYSEIHNVKTNEYGLFNFVIGQGESPDGDFEEIPWESEEIWLEVAMDETAGNDFKVMTTTKLLTVPYAFHAGSANELIPVNPNGDGRVPWWGQPWWNIEGLEKTDPDKHFVGNIDSVDLVFRTNNLERLRIKADGEIVMPGDVEIGGSLQVNGDSTIVQNLYVLGQEAVVDHNLYVDSIFSNAINSDVLHIRADVPDLGQGGYVATFENTNNDKGDGIKIQLGKKASKNNAALVAIDQALFATFVGEIDQADRDAIKALFAAGNVDYSYLIDMQIPTGAEVAEFAGAIAATGCILANTISNLLITELNDALGLPIDLGPLPDIPVIPQVDFGCDVFGAPISLPTFSFDDIADPLTNENVFVKFTDQDDKHVGAIKAQSLEDWVQDYFNKVFLFELYSTMKGVDKLKTIQEVKKMAAKTAKAYYEIGVEYSSGNGDYAEWLERLDPKEDISTGDIVAVVGGKITKDLTNAEQVMAVSHRPIVLGNIPAEGKQHLGNNIAFMGQIPVKVMGPVATGDYIVGKGSIKGYGVAVNPENMTLEDFKHTVGRSWDTNRESGPKMVNTVVGVHNGDYLNVLKRYEAKFKESEARLESVESKIDMLSELMLQNKKMN